MSALGAFTFVLHGHLPYSPVPTRWPYGETITYALISKTYIPLLQTLYDLKDEGIDYKLAICLTPTLVEQLANPAVIEQLNLYLDEKIAAAERDTLYFSEESGPPVDSHLKYLAEWYVGWYSQVKTDLNELCNQDLVGAFRRLQDEGYIEIIATAATSAYLPLLGHESAIAAQIKTGLASYEQFFGRPPGAFWIPECGYRPGLEEHLVREGLKVFFAEPHMITNTPPIGVAAGDVHGPLNTVKQRYMIPRMLTEVPQGKTTIQPYKLRGAPDLVVIGRDDRATMQVWGAINGYPGDVDYREPRRRYGTNNLQYWRVTGELVDPHDKDYYHPDWAHYKVEQHAEHFAHLVGDMIREYHNSSNRVGLISAHFDARLFGHWWFEGSQWLGIVLRHLADTPSIELTTPLGFITAHSPQDSIDVVEGSWGNGGGHFIWDNPSTHWILPLIHQAEARMEVLAKKFKKPSDDERVVLNQAARELMLLQSADWPLLITTQQDHAYAAQRVKQHLERFETLANSLESGQADRASADAYWETDQIFATMDYRVYARP